MYKEIVNQTSSENPSKKKPYENITEMLNYFFIKSNLTINELKFNLSLEQIDKLKNAENFECRICLHILNNPIQCSQCNTFSCKICFITHKSSCIKQLVNKSDPMQNKSYLKTFINKLDNLEINCPLNVNPCRKKIKIIDIPQHLNSCENSINNYTCKFCNFFNCEKKKKFEQEILMKHIKECKYFSFVSENCEVLSTSNETKENFENESKKNFKK